MKIDGYHTRNICISTVLKRKCNQMENQKNLLFSFLQVSLELIVTLIILIVLHGYHHGVIIIIIFIKNRFSEQSYKVLVSN